MSNNKLPISIGFLFDIDGVLTFPVNPSFPKSHIDHETVSSIALLLEHKFNVAFATGRSWCWIKSNLVDLFPVGFFDRIPIFLEYGLVYWWHKEFTFTPEGTYFRKNFVPSIFAMIAHIYCSIGILFNPNKVWCDYPDHGSLWIEDKVAMLSIAANKNISAEEVHTIVKELPSYVKDSVRIIYHHLGVDILPSGWSKSKAAYKCKELLTDDSNNNFWYVFGDNVSDKEMCLPFENTEFIDTTMYASETTKNWIKKILSKNI